nr:non-ribosomal peptide synthetase [Rhodococcus sp. (in: high G+C Gram-positive bacteria)]
MPTGRPTQADPKDIAVRLEQLADWNDTLAPIETRSVMEFFADQVELRPEAIAVVDGPRRISYADLNRLVGQLATHLRDNGVADEAVVAVGMPRSAEMVVSILAILSAGGAFVPLDPQWPADRRAGVLADSGAVRILRSDAAVDDFPSSVVDLDAWEYDGIAVSRYPCASGTRLAYVIFTSGSTGRPKGAMIRHEAIAARLRWQVEEILHFGPDDASMFKAPLSFDISVNEILLPLVSGGRVVVAKPGGERDPQYLLDLIATERVTFVYLVSSMLDVLLELSSGTELLNGLTHVWCGGEVLTPELFDRFRSALTTTLYHGYGPAEATIGVSHVIYRDGADRIATSIGRPNPNTQLYVLDDALRPVGIGEGGELYAAGFLLGRGYVGAPGLTAGRFVANPFGDSGSRLYRTGDLARWAPDGSLDFLGRADNQVKIRGMRLELEDVENGLASHPGVRQTCVIVGEHTNGTKYLIGYAVPHSSATDVTPELLREWATGALPEYMVPAAVVVLDEFPVTPNGKLDRRALPLPVFASSSSRAPQSDTERALCSLFAEVLGSDDIGVDDDFFAMGGDSIVAISLVSKARRAGLGLRPGDVFRLRTPAALAPVVAGTDAAADPEDIGVGHVLGTPIVRWMGDVGGAVDGFVQSTVLVTPAGVTYSNLRDMIGALLERHPMLRSRLDRTTPWSLYVPEDLPELDDLIRVVEGVDRLDRESADAATRLDPDAGLMMAAVHLDAGSDTTGLLVLCIHHLVIDGVSWRVIFDDLADAWASITVGEPVSLPDAGTSFRRWSARLERVTAGGVFDAGIEAWIDTLSTPDALLGTRELEAADIVALEKATIVTAPENVTAPLLTTVPAAFGAGVNDVLLTALAVALMQLRRDGGTAQTHAPIELEGHGREGESVSATGLPDVDLARTVGWFTTLFPVVVDPGTPIRSAFDPEYLAQALKAVKETLRAVPDKGLSWGALRYLADSAVADRLAGTAAPQVLFNYLGRFDAPSGEIWTPAADVGTLGEQRDPGMRLPRALEINAVTSDSATGPQLSATFSWPAGVFENSTIEALTGYWLDALTALSTIADRGGRTPSDFGALSLTQAQIDGFDDGRLVDLLPLTPLQEGLYFHSTYDEGSRSSYVEQQIIEIDGLIDAVAFRRAADALMQRHPNLGAGFFALADGRVVSVLTTDSPVEWKETTAATADIGKIAAVERARGFDLDSPPLMRYLMIVAESRTVIVQTVHHIVADGWSVPLMLAELKALYDGDVRDTPTPFRTYVDWLAERDDAAAEQAWARSVGDVSDGTLLVGTVLGTESDSEAVTLHDEVAGELSALDSDALTAAAREAGLTLGTVVHGAWALLLGRLLGRADVVFGSTVSGRGGDLAGIDEMIGLFVNTVPVRMQWNRDVAVRDVLEVHQNEQAELLDHQHLGLGRVQRLAGHDRLFDTLVVFETELDLNRYAGTSLPVSAVATVEAPHYPITLLVKPGERLSMRLLFDSEHVERREAEALLERLTALLSTMSTSFDVSVESLDLLHPNERDVLLRRTPGVNPAPVTILDRFADNAARYPNSVAVRFTPFGSDAADQLNYAELDRDSNRLARVLLDLGVGPESRVGLALGRSTLMVTAVLAVLKAGGAYVPLDTHHPAERLSYIAEDSAPVCVLTTADLADSLRTVVTSAELLVLDSDETTARREAQSGDPLSSELSWHNTAYVIYTSGSTGKPKGVLVPHRTVIELLANTAKIFDFRPTDVWTMFHSFAFDFSVWELWGPLLHGSALVVVDQDVTRSPEHFLELVRTENVTVLNQTPSAFYQLIEADRDSPGTDSLRYVVFGGEALDLKRLTRWYERHPVTPTLVNMYGITETTVHVSHLTLDPELVSRAAGSTIGAPIAGLHMYLLDASLRPTLPGFAGEIYVSGGQLARGYLGRVDLTAARFVADPFGSGNRLYRTGDVGRWNGNGELEFVGRADDQVKIRGYRIELGEIEAAILAAPGVRDTTVMVREDVPGIRRIVAYVVGADTSTLSSTLAETLPDYMIPSAFVQLESMPLTVNGKLDRKALPAPVAAAPMESIADGTDERVLASLFADILGVEDVGADSDFFALGGDSIIAITLVNRARKAGIRFTPKDVFSDRTPRLLARRVPQERVASGSGSVTGIGRVPMLPIVHRLRELGGPIDRFNQSMLVHIPASTADHVAAAVEAVLDRHDALRMRMGTVDPGSLWHFEIPPSGSVSSADVVTVVPTDSFDEIADESSSAADRLDPSRGIMLQVVWFDAGQRPGRLLVVAHHLVVDGVSWHILLSDLAQAFENAKSGRVTVLDPVITSVREFARGAVLHAHESTAELALWSEILGAGGPLVDDVVAAVRPLADTLEHRAAVSPAITEALLTTAPVALRTDITDLLLAALLTAFGRWHREHGISTREILVDLERHGRQSLNDRTDLTRTVGWFTAIAPMSGQAHCDPLVSLHSVTTATKAIPNGGIGFGLLRYLDPQTSAVLTAQNRPQVLFNYMGRTADTATHWGRAPETAMLRTDPDPQQGTPYVLEVNAECITVADGNSLVATFAYTDDLGIRAAQDIAASWTSVLSELVHLGAVDASLSGLNTADIETVAAVAGAAPAHIWPLSPLQEGLYFQAQYAGAGDVYTAQNVLTFDRRLDAARLERAAAAVLRRHPAAAAGFTGDSLPSTVQFVPSNVAVSVRVVEDSEDLPAVVELDRTTGFDLTSPPLLRLTVVRGREGDDTLLFTYHLLLWDGWSRELVLSDFFALYESETADLTRPTAGFDDYLAWLTRQDQKAAANFWTTELSGIAEPTLVAGTSVAAVGASPTRPRLLLRTLTRQLSDDLVDCARGGGVTLNSLLTVALASVLGYVTGSHDVVFGTTVSGRPTDIDGIESVVGVFLNTVPVRVHLSPSATVRGCASEVQTHRVDAMPYEHLGLGDIQRLSGHARLFDSLFVLQNFLDDDTFTEFEKRHGITSVEASDSTHYPFTWVVTPGAQLGVKLEFRPDLVSEEIASALLDRFEAALNQIAADIDSSLSEIELELPAEADHRASTTAASLADIGHSSIADLLAAQTDRTPDRTALVFGDSRMTFAEFDSAVSRLAHSLLDHGCGPERIVALALPRSIDAVVALFAVLRAGAAYLPLELDYPDDRLLGILSDAAPSLLVTTSAIASRFGSSVPALVLDDPATAASLALQNVRPPTDEQLGSFAHTAHGRLDHIAYVIYTSGSTGKPKGVLTPYRGLTNMQINHQREIFDPVVESVSRSEGREVLRIAHTVSFSFDMSWEELLWLVEGHEVHICDEELRRDATALVSYCDDHRIDVVNVTPTYAHHLIGEGLLAGEHRPALVLLGGEAVSDSVWQGLRAADGVLGYNLYGPTEYTINTLGGGTSDSDVPTVGRPILNTTAHVLDSWLRPVPDGIVGELYIAGAGLGRGYLERYATTSERFVSDPYSPSAGRIYRTGDLVRRGADGAFEFLGRSDDQVKIRGYRVETGEVESAIAGVSGVAHAAVVAQVDPSTPGAKRLAAYVLARPEVTGDGFLAGIREALLKALPDYMVPALYALVDELPLTVNGKLDVKALPDAVPLSSAGRAASTEFEHRVGELFADVLDLNDQRDADRTIGAEDDFFVLGGHSMLAIRLIGRIRSEFSMTLSIRDLFELRTPAMIAARLEDSSADTTAVLLEAVPQGDPTPISPAQERLWLVDRLADGSSAYTYPLVVRLRGHLDTVALSAALNDVAQRHEVLRSVVDSGEIPKQRVLEANVPVSIHETTEDRILADVRTEVDRPFDLSLEIPLRATVLRVSDGDSVLVLVLHHMATDEWSDRPFFDDLDDAYRARIQGSTPSWTPLPVQYSDYARWQRAVLVDNVDRLRTYWSQTLAGIPTETSLPLDRPRMPERVGASGQVRLTIDADVAARLRSIAADHGASAFMVVHAAVAALVHRLGAGDDVVLGSPISGRNDVALDDLVGFFVNTLVLRTDLGGDPTFAELVERTRAGDLDAFEHQELPFQQVVEALNPERAAGLNPLFQVAVGYHNRTDADRTVLGLDTEWLDGSNNSAKFDLHFSFVDISAEADSTLLLSLEYATDLFDADTAHGLARRIGQVLGAVAADPATRVSALPILVPALDETALDVSTAGSRGSTSSGTLLEKFREVLGHRSTATALVDGGRRWTYAELDSASDVLADELVHAGVVAEDRVAIALPRSGDQIVAMLAVVKASAAYVPVDVTYPQPRQDYILADSGAVAVVTESGIESRAVEAGVGASAVTSQGAAYVIYTSGSTGNPKGVVVPHSSVLALFEATSQRFEFDETDVWTMFHSFAFDFSVWEIWGPLLHGATLVIVDHDTSRSPAAMADLVKRERVTVLSQTPSAFLSLIDIELSAESLRYIVFGGEALDVRRLRPWFARVGTGLDGVGGPVLVNMYGITETCVHVSFQVIDTEAAHSGQGSIVGTALPGLDVAVLDKYLNPVPRGVAGEMYIAGEQLARGYLGQAALTSTRFVADPTIPGGRLYRSGDLARWVRDGEGLVLDYLGRADDQVKLRGFRIELGEIETAVLAVDGVRHAAVVLLQDRLVAYFVGSAPESAVEVAVQQSLPSHQVPSAFVSLDVLPLTTNGKLDRRALPMPDFGSRVTQSEPATETETVLAELFARVLGLSRVGTEDNFFHLGGHSLLAMQILSGVQSHWGVELQMRALFDHPTVRELAATIDTAPRNGVAAGLGDISRPKVLPLSYAQHRMWAMYRVDGASETYNVPLAWQLEGDIDSAALSAAVDDVVRRHEALRTIYPDVDGEAIASIVDAADISGLTVVESVDDVTGYLEEAARYRFELDSELPVRSHLASTGPGRAVLLILVHHIAIDEWSTMTITADLALAYRSRREGLEPEWGTPAPQYQDYALWQRAKLGSDREAGSRAFFEREYWTRTLTELPVEMALPVDRARAEHPSGEGGIVEFTLDATTTGGLRRTASDGGVTMFVLAHALVSTLLVKVGAGEDIVIGTPISGRSDASLSGVVGLFLNSLVLRTDVAGDPTFSELLERVRETDLAAFAHQELPFDRVVDAVDPQRTRARHPLFQTMLVYISGDNSDAFELPGATVTTMPMGTGASKFDLGINLIDRGRTIDCEIEFARDLFDETTIETLARRLRAVATAVTDDSRQRLSAIDVLGETERRSILEQFNDTVEPQTHDTVPALFAATAAATPDAPAVVAGETRLSYSELSARVNQLARHLRGRGVGSEDVVAVSLPRSAEMVVAVLAILTAGGAFVPLDPAWPKERRDGVLIDAAVTLSVTSAAASAAEVSVDLSDWAYDDESIERPEVDIHGASLAYVIFTSGSTGKPKGAMIRHEAICSRLTWQRDRILRFGAGDASLFKAPLAFDISVNEILLPLVSGGAVVVAEPDGERDALYLLDLIDRERVTFVYLVSSMLGVLLELAEGTERLAGLEHVWCGGEVLTPTLFERFRRQLGTTMYHGYGPAEATIGVSHVVYRGTEEWSTSSVEPAERLSTSIGRPNPNTRLYVLDNRLQPVPIGVPGELYAGGFLLGRGYVHAAGLTAGRFVADPFGTTERLYRTGDLARWNADGTLDFMGRADNQVKIRGMRLELEDVEVALASHPAVRQSAVLALDNASGSKYLAGYVRLDSAASDLPTPADLIAATASKVPEYMVPTAIVVLDEFPVTANGKLDRRKLPVPELGGSASEDNAVQREPTTRSEIEVCSAFSSVLGVETIGPDDDFFTLGGDSISVVRLASALRKKGLTVGPRQLFEHRTPASIARLVEPQSAVGTVESPDYDAPAKVPSVVPLTPALRWMVENAVRIETFGSPMVLVVPSLASADTVERALRAVVQRHEMLRSSLIRVGENWTIHVADDASAAVRTVDAREVDDLENSIRVEAEAINQELNPYTGDIVRGVWFDRGDLDGRLLLIVHHMAVDGMSWRIITEDLADAFARIDSAAAVTLPEPPTGYVDFSRAMNDVVSQRKILADLPHWFDVTEARPTLRVGRAASDSAERAHAAVHMDSARTTSLLTEAPRTAAASTADIVLAALGVALGECRASWSGSDAVVPNAISLQGHGRHDHLAAGTDVSRTVGWFAEDYPVLLGHNLTQALADIRKTPHDGATYGVLKYLSGAAGRALARQSEPEIFFNYHGTFGAPELRQWQMDPAYGRIFADWEADRLDGVLAAAEARVVPSDAGHVLELTVTSRPHGLTAASLEELAARWLTALDAVVAAP